MPTYEFRCPAGHDFERFYKTISTAPAELECPRCGAVGNRQLSAGAGLHFKGSGFYLTDYGKNAHRKAGSDKPDSGQGTGATGERGGKSEGGTTADAGTSGSKGEGGAPSSSSGGSTKAESGGGAAGAAKPKTDAPKPPATPRPKSE